MYVSFNAEQFFKKKKKHSFNKSYFVMCDCVSCCKIWLYFVLKLNNIKGFSEILDIFTQRKINVFTNSETHTINSIYIMYSSEIPYMSVFQHKFMRQI